MGPCDVRACAATKDQMWVRVLPQLESVLISLCHIIHNVPQFGYTPEQILISESQVDTRVMIIPHLRYSFGLCLVPFPTAAKFCDYVKLCYHQRITKFLRSGLPYEPMLVSNTHTATRTIPLWVAFDAIQFHPDIREHPEAEGHL